jgi:hypothetical protein
VSARIAEISFELIGLFSRINTRLARAGFREAYRGRETGAIGNNVALRKRGRFGSSKGANGS